MSIAARESGLSQAAFENADEQPTNSFLYNLSINSQLMAGNYNDYSAILNNDRLFVIQSEVIKKVAAESPCVIVGRCADYILADDPDLVSVFIHASDDFRISRIMDYEHIPESKAKSFITKADKKRGSYYNYYTGKRWDAAASYHLCLESSALGIEKTAAAIAAYLRAIEA